MLNNNAVSGLYHSNPSARTIFEELAKMPKENETLVEAVARRLMVAGHAVPRREVIIFFKNLDRYGAGVFIAGRKGHPSRFRWKVDSLHIAPALSGSAHDVPISKPEANTIITHRFQLRPTLTIALQLPSDITNGEARRLAQFIGSLPFHVEPSKPQHNLL